MFTIREHTNSFAIQLKNSLIPVQPTRLQYGKMLEWENSPIKLELSNSFKDKLNKRAL